MRPPDYAPAKFGLILPGRSRRTVRDRVSDWLDSHEHSSEEMS
jgi:hypothetical protein